MLYSIWELFINILETSLFLLLTNQKMVRKEYNKTAFIFLASIAVMSLMEFCVNSMYFSTMFSVPFCLILHFSFTCILFSSSWLHKLFWSFLYSVMGIASEAMLILLPTAILNIDINQILSRGSTRVLFTLVYIGLLSFWVVIALSLDTKTFRLKKSERFVFAMISSVCIIIEQLLFISLINIAENENQFYVLVAVFFLVMLLYFAMIFYVYNLGIEREHNIDLTRKNLIATLENKQYSQVISSIKEWRIIKHDIRNHLSTLLSFLQSQNYADAINYISEIDSSIEKIHFIISSGNVAMDSIISEKLRIAINNGISVSHTIHLPRAFPLDDIETCSLFGNLLDNALESCMNLKNPQERYINLHIKPFNNMLSIKLTNGTDGNYIKDSNGKLLTSKSSSDDISESNEHGIGLKRIQDIVEKHHGIIELEPKQEVFTVSIIIPLTNIQEYKEK